jgi:hypothetical protein
MEGLGRALLQRYADPRDRAIKNVDLDSDFIVNRELSQGDETYFTVGIEPVDSAEKLFFDIKKR